MINSRKRTLVSTIFLGLLFIMIIGITYAYYAADVRGNTSENPSLKLKSGYLSIAYEGQDSKITGGSTSGITDDLVYTKNFSVTNDGVADAYFGVWIKDYNVVDSEGNATTLSRPEDWTFVLKSGDTIIKTGTFPTEDEALITAYPLSVNETKDLTLTVTYNYITLEEGGINQTEDMNKVLSFNISVTQSLDNLESAKAGTLLASIRDNSNYIESNNLGVTENTTIPGRAASLETEAILSSTLDDYGTSYYYRGNVQNNYVTYSNMCWRIVRVQGDGTVKLALADWQHPCGEENGYSETDADSAFIADQNGNVKKNIAYKQNSTFNEQDFTFENSDISLILSTWAENKKLNMSELVETEWCNDLSIEEERSYGYDIQGNKTTDQNIATEWNTVYDYNIDKRLKLDTAEPTLKCNQKGLKNTKSIRYKNVLGILSSDEVTFAGATLWYGGGIWEYYLIKNASANFYLTMTPAGINVGVNAYIHAIFPEGFIDTIIVDATNGSVRPTIVLRRDVTVTTNPDIATYGGPGTVNNPYIID